LAQGSKKYVGGTYQVVLQLAAPLPPLYRVKYTYAPTATRFSLSVHNPFPRKIDGNCRTILIVHALYTIQGWRNTHV